MTTTTHKTYKSIQAAADAQGCVVIETPTSFYFKTSTQLHVFYKP